MMSSAEEMTKLRRKLATLEPTVKEMLALDRPTSILKEKLAQAEGLVMEIPDETAYFVAEWRGKLAHWYKQYSALLSAVESGTPLPQPPTASPTPLNQLVTYTKVSMDNNNQHSFQSSGYASAAAGNRAISNLYKPSSSKAPAAKSLAPAMPATTASVEEQSNLVNSYLAVFEPSNGADWQQQNDTFDYSQAPGATEDDNQANQQQQLEQYKQQQQQQFHSQPPQQHSIQLEHFIGSKESVRAQLEAAFALLPTMESFTEREVLRKFGQLVAKADHRLEPFWRDRELQEDMLERLRQKMPTEKWEQFSAFVGNEPHTIRHLKRFIVRQLRQVERRLEEQAAQVNPPKEVDESLQCVYCHNVGHLIESCIHLINPICYHCFEEGHTSRRCPKEIGNRRYNEVDY